MENQRIHDQRIVIDTEDKFVTINHNGDELSMNLECFNNLLKMLVASSNELHKQINKEVSNFMDNREFPKMTLGVFDVITKQPQHLATYRQNKNQ
jgi:hypothetical protein